MSESTDRPGSEPSNGPFDPTAPPADAGWPAPGAAPTYGEPTASTPQPTYGQPQPQYPPTANPAPPASGQLPTYPPPTGYGQQPTGYGQPPTYGQYPAYGPPQPTVGTYGPPAPTNGSALALTIISGIGAVSCCLLTVPSLIFGIIALTKQGTDPAESARMTRYGWIAFGITIGVVVLATVGFLVAGAAGFLGDGGSYEYEYEYDDSF